MADKRASRRGVVCPECGEAGGMSRREFMEAVGGVALVATASAVPIFATPRATLAAPKATDAAETAVKRLYDSLKPEQKSAVAFAWDHVDPRYKGQPLRTVVGNNWAIVKPQIKDVFTPEQIETIKDIFRGVTSEDGYARMMKQMSDDSPGGFPTYHVAIFGEPGPEKKFEWVLSGRHMTIRADGNSTEGTAFGGPIFYGHAASGFNEKPGHPGNVYWRQAVAANEVFKAMDGKQRSKAMIEKAPPEDSIDLRGDTGELPGIAVAELSRDQKELVEKVMKELLAPYRQADVDEAMECIKAAGGMDKLRLSYYKLDETGAKADIGNDGVWDIWRLEGPALVWHFRGYPHVHTWVNIRTSAATSAAG